MKYSAASGECGSPKSPTVVVFPTFFRRPEPLSPDTSNLKSPNMPSSPDRMLPVDRNGSQPSETSGYSVVQVENRLPSHGINNQSLYPVSSTAHLISGHSNNSRGRPSHFHGFGYKNNGQANSDEFLDNRSRRSSGLYMDKRNSHCSIRWSNLFFIIVTIVLFILVGILFYTVFALQSKVHMLENNLITMATPAPLAQQEPTFCLPCEELTLGPFDEDTPGFKDLLRKHENGKTVCCAQTSSQHSILLNLFAKRKNLEKCAQELLQEGNRTSCNQTTGPVVIPPARPSSPSFISAHLLAGTQSPVDKDPYSFKPIRNWLTNLPGTHLQGIKLQDDKLVVPETGVYFLYSQVGFVVYYNEDEKPDANGAQSLFHTVSRYNVIYPKEQELLRSSFTQCWERQKDYGRYTSYVGASVMLNKGDTIYVTVSKIQFLATNEPETTYFGLFKLS